MTTLLKSITGTENLIVNVLVSIPLTLIAISLIALVSNLIINPSLIANASF